MLSYSARWRLQAARWSVKLRRALLRGVEARASGTLQIALRDKIAEHRARLGRGEPLPALQDVEFKVFSQNGEDGILLYLLAIVGWERRRFFEIGIQDGWECNCASLAKHLGWHGWFVEGDAAGAALARQHYELEPATAHGDIRVINAYVTRENLPELVMQHGVAEVDVLSIDIDGMDWWIWEALQDLRPRIAVVEYNAAFGPERSLSIPYAPHHDRHAHDPSGLYYGASLTALERLGQRLGYRLVGCNSRGVNAFFVRDDIAPPALLAVPAARAFRENLTQRRVLPQARQFEAIAHLPFETI